MGNASTYLITGTSVSVILDTLVNSVKLKSIFVQANPA